LYSGAEVRDAILEYSGKYAPGTLDIKAGDD